MVGLGRVVSARAAAAAECWAFLMLVPSASHCCSPSVSLTEKIFKDQRGRDGIERRDHSGMLGRKETRIVECHARAAGSPWSGLVLAPTAACTQVGPY